MKLHIMKPMSEEELVHEQRGESCDKKLRFSQFYFIHTLLLVFLEAREHLHKKEPITESDINEVKHETSTLQTISLVF